MRQAPAAPGHHPGIDPSLAFTGAAVFREVVAVHVGQVLQQPLDLPLAPAVGRKSPLKMDKTFAALILSNDNFNRLREPQILFS